MTSAGPHSRDLTVSVVVYEPEVRTLRETIASLLVSAELARGNRLIDSVAVDLVDNGSEPGVLERVLRDLALQERDGWRADIVRGHGNVGYGRGHNIPLLRSNSLFHLVLNPDVIVAETAISKAAEFLLAHPEAVMITPEVRAADEQKQYLCRDYPSVFTLYLRSFAPKWMRRRYSARVLKCEVRDRVDLDVPVDVPLASGCFMFGRTAEFKRVGGFSPAYFLYFEDYDLSKRMNANGPIMYVPDVKIVHFGGNTSRKGWNHVRMFVRSAYTFFQTHGWKLV